MLTVAPNNKATKITSTDEVCYHCGEACDKVDITLQEKENTLHFCCEGCKMVYEILSQHGMCQFYEIEKNAGISLKGKNLEQYAYLDDPQIVTQLIDFQNNKIAKATFHIPQIHCASCIWLLENLYQLNDGVLASKVNFLKKEVYLTFSNTETNYRKIVELLASIGYAPAVHLGSLEKEQEKVINRRFYYQLGVAGFAFGNIMLISLPEYLGLEDSSFREFFGYLNILLILPVVLYSARDYFQSAWQGLRQKHLNIDVPISLGILTLFVRSVFEIVTHTGAGYLDSLAGLVFFLLIGKWFQEITYHQLSFERDYKSYFPIAANVLKNGIETSVALSQLDIGDSIVLRYGELIPADGILTSGNASIDYSFVTGESAPVPLTPGEQLYAGGRQKGGKITMTVSKKVAQSYLTQLWNEDTFQKDQTGAVGKLANQTGKYFTIAILAIATTTLLYWLPKDIGIAINAFTAVLIIACPCAIALSIPFTFGNAMRMLGRKGFYLKNIQVLEHLHNPDAVVFDKTGTLTRTAESSVTYEGVPLSAKEKEAVLALVNQSSHPVSQQISDWLVRENPELLSDNSLTIRNFTEKTGTGISGQAGSCQVEIKKAAITKNGANNNAYKDQKGTAIIINGEERGLFISHHSYRKGLPRLLQQWQRQLKWYVLSGDNDRERPILEQWFAKENLHFEQSPKDKLLFIKKLQSKGKKVMMLGDGLNDAGALQQADTGIVIAEDTNNFTPACDAILDANQFHLLPEFSRYARHSRYIVYAAYVLAFVYNIIGLSFAVQGTLSPVIAAILMPLSSITIVSFGVLMTYWWRPE